MQEAHRQTGVTHESNKITSVSVETAESFSSFSEKPSTTSRFAAYIQMRSTDMLHDMFILHCSKRAFIIHSSPDCNRWQQLSLPLCTEY